MAQRAPIRHAVAPVRPNRIPPHNLDAEQSVLGAMLESRDAIANVIEILRPEDFYKPAHSEVYEAVLSLFQRGEPVDAITIADELTRRGGLEQIGGKPYIHGLLEAYPTASSAAHYARIVEEHALLRKMIEAGGQIQELGFGMPDDVEAAVDEAEELIYQVGDRRLRDDVLPVKGLLMDTMTHIEIIAERNEPITGVASGFADLDDMTTGFQPSQLIIVAARPSQGKSSLLSDFALNAAVRQGKGVVIFSLEMGRLEIVQRFLSSEARVDQQRIRKGSLQESDWAKLSSALGRLGEAPIFIDDAANVTMMEIRAKCRRLKAKHNLGLVIVDYLQLMQSPRRSENRQQEVSDISRSLKILARELDVPVICASQLNRGVEYRADKRPMLGDLRESGCLTGDTLVTLADGRLAPIASLVGQSPEVATLDGWSLSSAKASKVWRTGHRPTFRMRLASGRVVTATANHRFRTLGGWSAIDELKAGDRLAVPRRFDGPAQPLRWDASRVVLFLRHLWATDGCVWIGGPSSGRKGHIYYATSSESLARQVQHLLSRLGIIGRIKVARKDGYAPSFHVHVTGKADQLLFCEQVGGHGERATRIATLRSMLESVTANTNADTIPHDVWQMVRQRMGSLGISHRAMAELRGTTYGGSAHFGFSPSRETLANYASILQDDSLQELAESDVYWDTVREIEPAGEADVYDMTVPGTHNFIANGVVAHNSIEQDSDLVMFIYRDEVYNPDTDRKGEAEIILAKHRNGPTGSVHLAFMNQYTKFASIARGTSI